MNARYRPESGVHPAAWGTGRQGRALLPLVFALFLAGCGSSGAGNVAPAKPSSATATSTGEQAWTLRVLDLTNAVRVDHGLVPLLLDEAASLAAYDHAWDMHLRSYFDHVNPDGEGPEERLTRHGVDWLIVGENLGRGHASPEEVVQAWLESPVHRANILYPHWTHIGIGVHAGSSPGPWWAQEFFR